MPAVLASVYLNTAGRPARSGKVVLGFTDEIVHRYYVYVYGFIGHVLLQSPVWRHSRVGAGEPASWSALTGAWIDPSRKLAAGGLMTGSRLGEGNVGIDVQGQCLLLPTEAIVVAPVPTELDGGRRGPISRQKSECLQLLGVLRSALYPHRYPPTACAAVGCPERAWDECE
jgi:hypothetical protein